MAESIMVLLSGGNGMKKYKYKAKDYRKKVKKYWALLDKIEDEYYKNLTLLEVQMSKDIGIKDVEFFHADGGIVGIGNESRTLELIGRR